MPRPQPFGRGLSQLETSLNLVSSFLVSESFVSRVSSLYDMGSLPALTAISSMKHSCAKATVELVTERQAASGTGISEKTYSFFMLGSSYFCVLMPSVMDELSPVSFLFSCIVAPIEGEMTLC